ncbi:MAG: orotate phosphoribosyltransferase [Acidobacteriia bacterium]|nr:orotate phosphoribosyltransferase [Terriglobia bacterium]
MTEAEIITLFRQSRALLEGHFELSSGLHSDRYFQCALVLQDPTLATHLGSTLAKLFVGLEPIAAIAAPAIGGILVAHEVARALHTRAIFTERVKGTMTLRRGFSLQPGDRVIVVEDVITTGLSTRETMAAVEQASGVVMGVGALVDRSGGTAFKDSSVPHHTLVTLAVQSYVPAECPLCRNRIPIIKPGSRI